MSSARLGHAARACLEDLLRQLNTRDAGFADLKADHREPQHLFRFLVVNGRPWNEQFSVPDSEDPRQPQKQPLTGDRHMEAIAITNKPDRAALPVEFPAKRIAIRRKRVRQPAPAADLREQKADAGPECGKGHWKQAHHDNEEERLVDDNSRSMEAIRRLPRIPPPGLFGEPTIHRCDRFRHRATRRQEPGRKLATAQRVARRLFVSARTNPSFRMTWSLHCCRSRHSLNSLLTSHGRKHSLEFQARRATNLAQHFRNKPGGHFCRVIPGIRAACARPNRPFESLLESAFSNETKRCRTLYRN
jgi:hypothetical protein